MGRSIARTQIIITRSEAYVYSKYYERRWQLAGMPKDSSDLQEGQRWMHKSEDLVLEIAKSNQGLFETLGLARMYFPSSDKIKEITRRMYHFKAINIDEPPFDLNVEQLENWRKVTMMKIQKIVIEEYDKPINELVEYLENIIDREAG